jgi:hypothetical protein
MPIVNKSIDRLREVEARLIEAPIHTAFALYVQKRQIEEELAACEDELNRLTKGWTFVLAPLPHRSPATSQKLAPVG